MRINLTKKIKSLLQKNNVRQIASIFTILQSHTGSAKSV